MIQDDFLFLRWNSDEMCFFLLKLNYFVRVCFGLCNVLLQALTILSRFIVEPSAMWHGWCLCCYWLATFSHGGEVCGTFHSSNFYFKIPIARMEIFINVMCSVERVMVVQLHPPDWRLGVRKCLIYNFYICTSCQ